MTINGPHPNNTVISRNLRQIRRMVEPNFSQIPPLSSIMRDDSVIPSGWLLTITSLSGDRREEKCRGRDPDPGSWRGRDPDPGSWRVSWIRWMALRIYSLPNAIQADKQMSTSLFAEIRVLSLDASEAKLHPIQKNYHAKTEAKSQQEQSS